MNAFTHYWKADNEHLTGRPLDHIVSNVFSELFVEPGDFFFVFNQQGRRLILVGRLKVKTLGTIADARNEFGDLDFFEGREHIIGSPDEPSTIRFDRFVPDEIVKALRFTTASGETSIKFTPQGAVVEQAMRTMRKLTARSAAMLHNLLAGELPDLADVQSSDGVDESGRRLASHLRWERRRDLRIVAQKKASVKRPVCECCGFDFETIYGDRGCGFIECHHKIPVSKLIAGQKTSLESLALVCANCHRMLHRSLDVLTVDDLKAIIVRQQQVATCSKLAEFKFQRRIDLDAESTELSR